MRNRSAIFSAASVLALGLPAVLIAAGAVHAPAGLAAATAGSGDPVGRDAEGACAATDVLVQEAPQGTDGANAEDRPGGRGRSDQEGERFGRRGGKGMPLPPDWPRAGGFGPGAQGIERPMIEGLVVEGLIPGTFARRELTDGDVARVVAVAKEVSPEWGAAIEAKVQQDAEQVKSSLRTSGRRLLGLVALKERAPAVFVAKVAELRAQAETDRAATELQAAEAADGAARNETEIAKLTEALAASAARQVDATLAARRAELDALEERLAKLRADVASDGARREELAGEVVRRAQNRGDDRRAPRREPARE